MNAVVPKLAQPWWYKHAHSGRFILAEERRTAPSPEAQRIIDRKARKRRRYAPHGPAQFLDAVRAGA